MKNYDMLAYLNRRAQRLKNKKFYKNKDKAKLRIYIEGDSFTEYPLFIKEVGDQLIHLTKKYAAVYSSAQAGDTAENILSNKDSLLDEIERIDPHLVIISCGGNDILDTKFLSFLDTDSLLTIHEKYKNNDRAFDIILGDEELRREILVRGIKDNFEDEVIKIKDGLEDLVSNIDKNRCIIINTYFYPIPGRYSDGYWNPLIKLSKYVVGSAQGKWLHQKLNNLGLINRDFQYDVVRVMLSIFRHELKSLESHDNVFLYIPSVNFPSVLLFDEIHLRSNGYLIAAEEMLNIYRGFLLIKNK